MITSDDEVVEGMNYELVLTGSGLEPRVLRIKSETYAEMLRAWKRLEGERGKRLSFDVFFAEACRRYLVSRSSALPERDLRDRKRTK
jgi:hypothetical protein